jgi:CTP:molybdopterin cytidylyltransferase MocA
VILARGDSSRMGGPKGLCRTTDDDRPLIRRVHDLYRRQGCPVAVVTRSDLRQVYAWALAGRQVRWIIGRRGGDTAASVGAALLALKGAAEHLWLHPVDLPAVDPRTLVRLHAESRSDPRAVVIPEHGGRPGHPVVLPVTAFANRVGPDTAGPMREQLRRWCGTRPESVAPLRRVAVTDPGVVADLDDPASLAAPD